MSVAAKGLQLLDLSFRWHEGVRTLFGPLVAKFEPGSITTILGANGSGKTTLLAVMSQRLESSKGAVCVDGRAAAERDFNYVLQDSDRLLFPHLTLGDNINLGQQHTSSDLCDRLQRVLFEDEGVLARFPAHCSGGQRQRAVLCRALRELSSFPVTLLDEPFSQLSHEVKLDLYRLAQEMASESGVVLLVVTHDIVEAALLGSRVLVLNDGAIRFFDTSEIQSSQSFLECEELRGGILEAFVNVDQGKTAVNRKGAA